MIALTFFFIDNEVIDNQAKEKELKARLKDVLSDDNKSESHLSRK